MVFEKQPWMHRAGEFPGSDREYFGLLARAVFSAGLGPKVVESRWFDLQKAFCDFEPEKVQTFSSEDVERLLADPKVIRNRRKIEAVITNAEVFAHQVAEHNGFHSYLCAIKAGENLEEAAETLAQTFVHLGKTSALFFLFSAGWREREKAVS